MIYILYLGIGLLFGLVLAGLFSVAPEQQAVCITNDADGNDVRQTCLVTQKEACLKDLRNR